MKNHTSWRIGGPADIFAEPTSREEMQLAVSYAHERSIPFTIIGAGTNILVSDEGFRGIIIKVGSGLDRISVNENFITAEAGAKLSRLAAAARDAGLGGFEFLAGIPGTVGGAVVMNAGANGSSVSMLVKEILLLNPDGCFIKKTKDEMEFGYRSSILQDENAMMAVVVEAVFSCYRRGKEAVRDIMAAYIKKRKKTQPLQYPSAGSIFKNPPGDSAGRLIEAVGLKGERVGGAQISMLHANFIVNLGGATARDVLILIDRARKKVLDCFGIELKTEVKVIGCI
jgi:UDP-N-acetylmuramate dehydrogenase